MLYPGEQAHLPLALACQILGFKLACDRSVVLAWEDQRAELEPPPAQLKDAFYSQSKDQESDILERTEQTSAAGFVAEQDPAGNRPLPKSSAFKYGGNCM